MSAAKRLQGAHPAHARPQGALVERSRELLARLGLPGGRPGLA